MKVDVTEIVTEEIAEFAESLTIMCAEDVSYFLDPSHPDRDAMTGKFGFLIFEEVDAGCSGYVKVYSAEHIAQQIISRAEDRNTDDDEIVRELEDHAVGFERIAKMLRDAKR